MPILRNRPTPLYPRPPDERRLARRPPADTLHDLNLDQVFASISAGADEYQFAEIFECPADDLEVVEHRHEVFRDLENDETLHVLRDFVVDAAAVRTRLAQKLYDDLQAHRWFLGTVLAHCRAVAAAGDGLAGAPVSSAGLCALRGRLAAYRQSTEFTELFDQATRLDKAFEELRFVVFTHAGKITVAAPGDEPDFAGSVLATFERFASVGSGERREEHRGTHQLDRVESAVLHLLSQLYPKLFTDAAEFHRNNAGFVPQWLQDDEREAAFFLQYVDFMQSLDAAGTHWVLPTLSRTDRTERVVAGCDVALARQLAKDHRRCVANDWQLTPPEQILAVSGPNQGGKTTTARMFGQLHYLASLGLPVPAVEARLFLPDAVYTHFERAESIETLAGKLEDELRRARSLLERATKDSVVIFNETFGSTSLADAYALGASVLRRVIDVGAIGVYVTFVDELTRLDEHVVSMMSTTDTSDDSVRTFKVVRKRADGKVHAAAIARRYHLTYQDIRQQVAS
ncbi:MutS-related protein [Flexivirga caeni]|uniref:DNA mismatch repair proteins mutS family domain-containing protein n=1 Tax=Flexivirga caeni TaxID=2294115 RepID=A0A3M9MGP9_9MICO|nr:hypothetical protein [Flexivirga caeni]RNI24701.1 hypothetical protein EFY87_03095 [Flexivirga caeni]